MLRRVSSSTAMTEAREEFFSADTASLPRPGTMVRIACGAITRRMSTRGVMPSACPAAICPGSTPQNAGAQDLGDERALVGGQRQAGRGDRAEPQADMRQGVIGEDELQDQRGAAEDDGVGAGEGRQQTETAELHARQHQPHPEPTEQTQARDFKGEDDALGAGTAG